MNMTFRRAIALQTVAFFLAGAAHAQMRPNPDEVQVGPVNVPQSIQGVPLVVRAISFMSVSTAPAGLAVRARMFADLSDLQAKIGTIVDTFPLPRNNCSSYSADNPVVTINSKKLTQQGNSLIFAVSGDVVMWDCRENPIPNSKVEWRNDGPFGLSIPHIVTWPGSPFKNKLITQPLSATIPITLSALDATTLKVNLGAPNVQLGGNPFLAPVRNFLLNLFGVNVNGLAASAINSAVDPAKLQATLPADFMRLNPKIVKASFTEVDGNPGAEVDAQALVVASNLTDILKAIADRGSPHPH